MRFTSEVTNMTTVQKNVTQRLFGRTVIDSLDLNQNAWYIDEVQVTATADELNAAGDGIATVNVYNDTGGAFVIGKLLHVSGYNAASGYLKVELADADNSKPAQYIALDTTANGSTTYVADYLDAVTFNTTGAAAGDPVYLSAATPGAFSLSAPTGADDVVQIVGRVKLHNNAAGTVIVDLRKTEQVKIGTNEIVDASITDAKIADDVATGLAGTAANTALAASSGVLTLTPSDNAMSINGDSIVYVTAAGVPKKDAFNDVVTAMVGTASTTGLAQAASVISVAPADNAVTVGTDSIVYMTQAGLPKKDLISDLTTLMAGEGLGSSVAGVLNLKDDGQTSHGGVFFTDVGDCTSVTVGAAVYVRDDTPTVTIGEWASGGTPAEAAANLADSINLDQRNAGGPYYIAEDIGAGVVIRALTPGTAGNVLVTRQTGAQPSTLQDLAEGRSAKACKVGTVYHTVTAFDALLAEFTLELPFAPDTWIVQVLSSTGLMKDGITDLFTFDGSPLGVKVTAAGGTHVQAGDIITVLALSL
jgi:hypothetical protein